MTLEEFSNEFDILYNSITSNQAPGLDEYEKSVFLTRAQNDLVLGYFNPKSNKVMEGFDGSHRRQIDFSTILRTVQYKQKEPVADLSMATTFADSIPIRPATKTVEVTAVNTEGLKTTVAPNSIYIHPQDTQADTIHISIIPVGNYSIKRAAEDIFVIRVPVPVDNSIVPVLKDCNITGIPADTYFLTIKDLGRTLPDSTTKFNRVDTTIVDKAGHSFELLEETITVKPEGSNTEISLKDIKPGTYDLVSNEDGTHTISVDKGDGTTDKFIVEGLLKDTETVTFVPRPSTEEEEENGEGEENQDPEPTPNPNPTPEPLPEFTFEDSFFDIRENTKSVRLPSDVLLLVNEFALVDRVVDNKGTVQEKRLQVLPISYAEYTQLMTKPYQRPIKSQAWRLLNGGGEGEDGTAGMLCELIIGLSDTLKSYMIRYVKRPRPIILSELGELSIDHDHHTSTCELDPIIHRDIVARAVELAKAAYAGDINTQIALGTNSSTELGMVSLGNNGDRQ